MQTNQTDRRPTVRRNPLARAVSNPTGVFRLRVKPSGKLYRRRARHQLRALSEALG